jgi:hypothetical protein
VTESERGPRQVSATARGITDYQRAHHARDLDQPTAATPEDKQMPAVRIALEHLLHQEGQAVKPFAHVGMAGRQPPPRPARDRNRHRLSSTLKIRAKAAISTSWATIKRTPLASTISIGAEATVGNVAARFADPSQEMTACANVAASSAQRRPARASRRHVNNWWPSSADGVVTITPAQLGYLLEGIDWRMPQHTWRPQAAG